MREYLSECAGCGYRPVINSRGKVVDLHDCHYVQAVNSLVEEAAKRTTTSMQFKKVLPMDWDQEWDAVFHRTMDQLRGQIGLPIQRKRG